MLAKFFLLHSIQARVAGNFWVQRIFMERFLKAAPNGTFHCSMGMGCTCKVFTFIVVFKHMRQAILVITRSSMGTTVLDRFYFLIVNKRVEQANLECNGSSWNACSRLPGMISFIVQWGEVCMQRFFSLLSFTCT